MENISSGETGAKLTKKSRTIGPRRRVPVAVTELAGPGGPGRRSAAETTARPARRHLGMSLLACRVVLHDALLAPSGPRVKNARVSQRGAAYVRK